MIYAFIAFSHVEIEKRIAGIPEYLKLRYQTGCSNQPRYGIEVGNIVKKEIDIRILVTVRKLVVVRKRVAPY